MASSFAEGRRVDRLGVTILNCVHISDSDTQAGSYGQFFHERGENNLKGVTISAMLVHPYQQPGEEFSHRELPIAMTGRLCVVAPPEIHMIEGDVTARKPLKR
ncbi:hypothetical protein Taro_007507 [Colocasia esculenta]|uniref:Uncharacterized protein n=1 Tax=Colocasia esculenta TaxID=4460 RepID=A0A843TVP2_COLES|nr:hypothetical protein [Colocasia esculenta]